MLKYDLNLREYWRVIKRRKLIIVFTMVVMGIFSFLSAMMAKPTPIYKATVTVKVERTPPTMGGQIQYIMPPNMETQAMMIRSYYVLELTAKRLGLIPEHLPSEDVRNNPKYIGMILDLKDRVTTSQEGQSDLINIEVKSNDPKFATRFANTLAEVYQAQHTEELNRRTRESKKFVESQFIDAKDKMDRAEEAVKKFREDNRWSSMDTESATLRIQIAKLQDQYDKDRLTLHRVSMALHALEGAEKNPMTAKTNFYFDEAPPPYKAMNDKLVGLLIERDTLLITYTEHFPQVRALKAQIHELIEGMRNQLIAFSTTLKTNIGSTKSQIDELERQLKRVPEKGLELSRLERDVGIKRELYTLLEKKYQEIRIAEAEKLEEVKIVKPAIEPSAPINPTNIYKSSALGTLMGLILGLVFAFLIETFDTSIGAVEEVEEFLGIHVLGIIPFVSIEEIRILMGDDPKAKKLDDKTLQRYARLSSHFAPTSTLTESYKAFRTSLNFLCKENNHKTIVFTSTSAGEGKTSIAVNLALTMAQAGYRVLIVDGDLRRPSLSGLFGIDHSPGLTDVVMGNYEWKAVVRTVSDLMMGSMSVDEIMKTPGLDNLNIVTSGTYTHNPSEIVGSKSIVGLIGQMREEYDLVVIDAPPVLAATDAALWSSLVDGTVMVYQVGKVARGALRRSKMQLESIKANLLGVVLNGIKAEISTDFTYHDYYYNYRYGYGRERKAEPWLMKVGKWFSGGVFKMPTVLLKMISWRRTTGKKTEEATGDLAQEKKLSAFFNKERREEFLRWPRYRILKVAAAIIAVTFLCLGILYEAGYLRSYLGKKVSTPPKGAVEQTAPIKTPAKPEEVKTAPPTTKTTAPAQAFSGAGKQGDSSAPEKKESVKANGSFIIVVKSTPEAKEAEAFVKARAKEGIVLHIMTTDIKDRGRWYRLHTDRFNSRDEAAVYIQKNKLKERFPDLWIMESSL